MPPTRRRDASEASIKLTRKNYSQAHLLSTFRHIAKRHRYGYSPNDLDEIHKPRRLEPAADDEPRSTTDSEGEPASLASSKTSIELTRNNYNRASILSTFRPITNRQSYGDSSDDPRSTEETHKPRRPEPATDDEPLSSTDDGSQPASAASSNDLYSRHSSKWSARDLDAKLADGDIKEVEDDRNCTPGRTRKSESRRAPRVAVKRKNDETAQTAVKRRRGSKGNIKLEDDSDEKGGLFGIRTANRRRRKQGTYSRQKFNNIHAAETKDVKPPLRNAESDYQTVHSSAKTRNVPVFRELSACPLDDFPSSSLPTDANNGTLFDPNASTSSCSSPPSSLADLDQKPVFKFPEPEPSRCPMCDEMLEDGFVKARPTKGLTVRKQMQYCRAHKIWTAEKVWAERKYPTIDWDNFDKRIEGHLSSLEDILMLRKRSEFRKELEGSKDGRRENIRLTAGSKGLDMLSTGYYGPRGSKVMSDAILTRFASKIRQLATADPLMKAAGPTGYVQGVLVPELSVMLVKEDMNVNDKGAIRIMKDSMWIGDLLNEVPNDVVNISRQTAPLDN